MMLLNYTSKLSNDDKIKYAKQFSEGSHDLEELLLLLWNNGINTVACCKGHAMGEKDGVNSEEGPTINLYVDNLTNEFIEIYLSNIIYKHGSNISNCMAKNCYDRTNKSDLLRKNKKLSIRFNYNNGYNYFQELISIFEKLINNNLSNKKHLLQEQEQLFIDDIITVFSLDLNNYKSDNPFDDIVAIGINDLWTNKFAITSRELSSLKWFDYKRHMYITKNTYVVDNGRYYIYSEQGIKEVDKKYILDNNIINFNDIFGSNLYEYNHNNFIKEIINLNNKTNKNKKEV